MGIRIGSIKDTKPVSQLSNKQLQDYSGSKKNSVKVRKELNKRGL